jgi:large repetitive protein
MKDMQALWLNSKLKKIVLFICFFGFAQLGFSQKLTTTNWYFGKSSNGIKFSRGTAKAEILTNKAIDFGAGGSAVATDPVTGNLLFYTDGNFVYDACGEEMADDLNANTAANQPVAICAVPEAKGQYYIFTNPAVGAISWSKVDMTKPGSAIFPNPPLGEVINPKNNPISGLTGKSEGMIVVSNTNGKDFWLITHKKNSLDYTATRIDATETFSPVLSTGIGTAPLSVANFSVSPFIDPAKKNERKIAVAPQSANSNALILNFDTETGVITLDKSILNSGRNTANGQAIYDIEWTNVKTNTDNSKNQYLYLSYFGDVGIPADVLQYDYLNPTSTLTSVLPTTFKPSHSLGLQVGADSAIYYLYEPVADQFRVGRFTKTDTIASQVRFEQLPFGAVDFNGRQFPAFLPEKDLNLTITVAPVSTCQNAPTTFYPTVTPSADSLAWNFGDGSRSNAWSPVHTFTGAGPSTVTVTAFLQGQKKEATVSVNVRAFALTIDLVQDTTACRDEFPPKRGTSSPVQFSITAKVEGGTAERSDWSNGQKGLTLRPDSAGYYYLTISDRADELGCKISAGVNVKEYGLNDQRSNKWYFGKNAGIDFNKTPPKALNNGKMNAPEGCAIVCDRNGQAIFYTNGDEVYNRDNERTTNGFGLGGSPLSSQSSLIFPVPGDETLYYIFTTQAFNETGSNNEVRYSLFDWKENNGKGDIVEKNVPLFAKATERITANGNWVIFHEYGNDVFRSYRITQAGIGSPVFSSVGSNHSQCEGSAEGYMRLGPNNTLAVPLSNGGNFIELFHLNDTTGRIVKFSKDDANNRLNLDESAGTVYGVEFATSNKKGLKLFATVNNGAASKLVEFAIDSLSKSTLLKPNFPSNLNLGAIQTAPDGAIYVSVKDVPLLARILPSSDLTAPSSLVANDGFQLAPGTTSLLGLPNFRQQQGNGFGGPSLSVTGVCVGDSTRFTGQGTDSIDKYQWNVVSATTSTNFPFKDPTLQNPALFLPAGDYVATLRVYNRCDLDTTLTAKFTVFGQPAKPSLGSNSLCKGAVTLGESLPTSGLTYSWSTGETTRTIVVTQPLLNISVTITDLNGCTNSGAATVAESSVAFELSPDQTVCQNVELAPIKPFVFTTGYAYDWTITNESTGIITKAAGEEQPVDTSIPGVINYSVIVTDPTNGCFDSNQVKFNVTVAPKFTYTKDDATCNTPNGKIELLIAPSNPLGGPYNYSFTGPNAVNFSDVNVTPSSIPFNGLGGGTYSATVTDQLSGCATFAAIGLDAADWDIEAEATNTCDPASVTVTVSSGAATGSLSYVFTGNSPSSPIPSPSNPTLVPSGSWTVQATDAAGCVATTSLTIPPNPIQVAITTSLCTTPATLTANAIGASSYVWTANTGIVSGSTTSMVSINRGGTYEVTASVGGCSITEEITVDFSPISPTLTQSDRCSNEVTVTATPAGNYSYSWSKDNDVQTNLVGSQILLGSGAEGSYKVTLRDRDTGCSYSSDAVAVNIVGNITASLSSTPPCKDGKEFTLTASSPSIPSTGVKYAWTLNGSPIPETTFSIKQSTEGKYQVTVSSAVAPECNSQPSITIVRNAIPEGNLPSGAIICADPDNKDPATAKVELNPGAFLQYQWYKNEVLLPAETKQKLTATSAGSYKVELTNSFNCTASDVTEVRNECIPKLVAPTAFNPGSKNAVNQNFFVYSFFITDEFEVTIFNRWGELMYESKDKNFKWNGTYNNQGQPLPPGMYAYSIKYVSSFRPEKGIQEQRGGVVLIR